ncbi:MAG: YbjN domain-containing protein [Actinomycetaceae bacterium]|nr:YbjN domain-containing protein [Actinomycetaceae bacterium]
MDVPAPVDLARMKHILAGMEDIPLRLQMQETETELVFPTSTAAVFINLHNPSILQIRGQWRGIVEDDEDFSELVQQVHNCNVYRSGPKAYLLPLGDGLRYGLGAETNLVVNHGASDAQLQNFYEVTLTMIFGFFNDVANAMPQLVTWEEQP